MSDEASEKKEILKCYQSLLKSFKTPLEDDDLQMIRKAFELALNAHSDMRRKSGELYIFHPLAVADIVVTEIGLGPTSVICALLHDVVEDTEFTIQDMEHMFNPKVAKIIDGLTKIEEIFDQGSLSIQAENFKKMLLTLSDDVNVILIKLADRLHNMRTLDSMPSDKQLKIASETTYLYAPLAHRLGLYAIKSELEDLAMKYTEPDIYKELTMKIERSAPQRDKAIEDFIRPLQQRLDATSLKYSISGRVKSINSIWGKMKKKRIPFEEVFDLFAIRIVVDSKFENEKADCWTIYSILTDIYRPNPARLRDWVSSPKSNGYEALHTTLMSHTGQWIEVQIRSKRMDEIAEKGYAAHWKYKQDASTPYQDSGLDIWLNKIREMLVGEDKDALDFLNEFKLNLFNEEIIVYTPKGEFKNMPVGSTVLDFAYNIHTELGNKAIGAKVNLKLVPINHVLQSGNQVEIISSKRQKPTEEWLNIATTARAKSIIRQVINEEKRKFYPEGKSRLENYLKEIHRELDTDNLSLILSKTEDRSKLELFYKIATEEIKKEQIHAIFAAPDRTPSWLRSILMPFNTRKESSAISLKEAIQQQVKDKPESLILAKNGDIRYEISSCCNPIPGDDVIGILMSNQIIQIHRTSCPHAIELMSRYGNRIVKTKWKENEEVKFLVGIKLSGNDRKGMWTDISTVISQGFEINVKSVHMDVFEGAFEGTVMVYISDVDHLNSLIQELKKVDGVGKVYRMS